MSRRSRGSILGAPVGAPPCGLDKKRAFREFRETEGRAFQSSILECRTEQQKLKTQLKALCKVRPWGPLIPSSHRDRGGPYV